MCSEGLYTCTYLPLGQCRTLDLSHCPSGIAYSIYKPKLLH